MMDGWDWFWGMLMMVLFWGGLVAAVVVGVRLFGTRRGSEPQDATTILRNRYARGEISDEEFEARMTVLDSRNGLRVGR
jgi:putative membrane protein